MRPFSLSVFVAMSQLTAFSLALPALDSSIVARSQLDTDAPTFKAATFPDGRNLQFENLEARRTSGPDPEVITLWVPNTQTHIIMTIGIRLAGNAVESLLANAVARVLNRILQVGDGVIDHGTYNQVGANAVSLQVWNANNHQTTYGVLGAALSALLQWMHQNDFVAVSFGIYDGNNQVGNGVVNGPG